MGAPVDLASLSRISRSAVAGSGRAGAPRPGTSGRCPPGWRARTPASARRPRKPRCACRGPPRPACAQAWTAATCSGGIRAGSIRRKTQACSSSRHAAVIASRRGIAGGRAGRTAWRSPGRRGHLLEKKPARPYGQCAHRPTQALRSAVGPPRPQPELLLAAGRSRIDASERSSGRQRDNSSLKYELAAQKISPYD